MKQQLMQLKDYGFFRVIRLGFSYLRTQLFYRPAMFIFFPIDLRGRRHISLGRNMTCGTGCRFEVYADRKAGKILTIGSNVQINDYVHISAIHSIKIGDNALLASRIYISDVQHGHYGGSDVQEQSDPECIAKLRPLSYKDVVIEDNVWVGEGVCILPGVTVGRCSIIGANSVVTKDIPAKCIAAGNPARIIKRYNDDTLCWDRCDE
jgi:lipopolysaccharide O-acetyltransferase